jgi:putative PIN family toxin of toxin-antitoxin system
MRVVLDTNVIISAFLWAGKVNRLLDLIERQKIGIYTCMEQIVELQGVLERPRFKTIFEKTKLKPQTVVSVFLKLAVLVENIKEIDIVKIDQTDNVILSCALSANAQYLITGDKHLLSLGTFQKVKIVRPKEFLEKFDNI